MTAVPNIYENSNLYNRETVEQRLEQYKNLLDPGSKPIEEEAPKSWIQLKAAAIAERKEGGATTLSQKSRMALSRKSKKKAAIHPDEGTKLKEPDQSPLLNPDGVKGQRPPSGSGAEDAMQKTEAPPDDNKGPTPQSLIPNNVPPA
jgi:hypothetical protein